MAMLAYGLEKQSVVWDKLKNVDLAGIVTMALGMGCLEVVLEEGNRRTGLARSSFVIWPLLP